MSDLFPFSKRLRRSLSTAPFVENIPGQTLLQYTLPRVTSNLYKQEETGSERSPSMSAISKLVSFRMPPQAWVSSPFHPQKVS